MFGAPASRVVSPGGQEMRPADCEQLAANPGWALRLVPDLEERCKRALADDRRVLNAELQSLLPKVMFVVLPLVALVQYWIYRRQRPLYLENLVFVLHFQSFFYLIGAFGVPAGRGSRRRVRGPAGSDRRVRRFPRVCVERHLSVHRHTSCLSRERTEDAPGSGRSRCGVHGLLAPECFGRGHVRFPARVASPR